MSVSASSPDGASAEGVGALFRAGSCPPNASQPHLEAVAAGMEGSAKLRELKEALREAGHIPKSDVDARVLENGGGGNSGSATKVVLGHTGNESVATCHYAEGTGDKVEVVGTKKKKVLILAALREVRILASDFLGALGVPHALIEGGGGAEERADGVASFAASQRALCAFDNSALDNPSANGIKVDGQNDGKRQVLDRRPALDVLIAPTSAASGSNGAGGGLGAAASADTVLSIDEDWSGSDWCTLSSIERRVQARRNSCREAGGGGEKDSKLEKGVMTPSLVRLICGDSCEEYFLTLGGKGSAASRFESEKEAGDAGRVLRYCGANLSAVLGFVDRLLPPNTVSGTAGRFLPPHSFQGKAVGTRSGGDGSAEDDGGKGDDDGRCNHLYCCEGQEDPNNAVIAALREAESQILSLDAALGPATPLAPSLCSGATASLSDVGYIGSALSRTLSASFASGYMRRFCWRLLAGGRNGTTTAATSSAEGAAHNSQMGRLSPPPNATEAGQPASTGGAEPGAAASTALDSDSATGGTDGRGSIWGPTPNRRGQGDGPAAAAALLQYSLSEGAPQEEKKDDDKTVKNAVDPAGGDKSNGKSEANCPSYAALPAMKRKRKHPGTGPAYPSLGSEERPSPSLMAEFLFQTDPELQLYEDQMPRLLRGEGGRNRRRVNHFSASFASIRPSRRGCDGNQGCEPFVYFPPLFPGTAREAPLPAGGESWNKGIIMGGFVLFNPPRGAGASSSATNAANGLMSSGVGGSLEDDALLPDPTPVGSMGGVTPLPVGSAPGSAMGGGDNSANDQAVDEAAAAAVAVAVSAVPDADHEDLLAAQGVGDALHDPNSPLDFTWDTPLKLEAAMQDLADMPPIEDDDGNDDTTPNPVVVESGAGLGTGGAGIGDDPHLPPLADAMGGMDRPTSGGDTIGPLITDVNDDYGLIGFGFVPDRDSDAGDKEGVSGVIVPKAMPAVSYLRWNDRHGLGANGGGWYTSGTAEEANDALARFGGVWGGPELRAVLLVCKRKKEAGQSSVGKSGSGAAVILSASSAAARGAVGLNRWWSSQPSSLLLASDSTVLINSALSAGRDGQSEDTLRSFGKCNQYHPPEIRLPVQKKAKKGHYQLPLTGASSSLHSAASSADRTPQFSADFAHDGGSGGLVRYGALPISSQKKGRHKLSWTATVALRLSLANRAAPPLTLSPMQRGRPVAPRSEKDGPSHASPANAETDGVVPSLPAVPALWSPNTSLVGSGLGAIWTVEEGDSSEGKQLGGDSVVICGADFGPFRAGLLPPLADGVGRMVLRGPTTGVGLPMGVKLPQQRRKGTPVVAAGAMAASQSAPVCEEQEDHWSELEDARLIQIAPLLGFNGHLIARAMRCGGGGCVAPSSESSQAPLASSTAGMVAAPPPPPIHAEVCSSQKNEFHIPRSARQCLERLRALMKSRPELATEAERHARRRREAASQSLSVQLGSRKVAAAGTRSGDGTGTGFLMVSSSDEGGDARDNGQGVLFLRRPAMWKCDKGPGGGTGASATEGIPMADQKLLTGTPGSNDGATAKGVARKLSSLRKAKLKKQVFPIIVPGCTGGTNVTALPIVDSHLSHSQSVELAVAASVGTSGIVPPRAEMWPLQFLDLADKQRAATAAAAAAAAQQTTSTGKSLPERTASSSSNTASYASSSQAASTTRMQREQQHRVSYKQQIQQQQQQQQQQQIHHTQMMHHQQHQNNTVASSMQLPPAQQPKVAGQPAGGAPGPPPAVVSSSGSYGGNPAPNKVPLTSQQQHSNMAAVAPKYAVSSHPPQVSATPVRSAPLQSQPYTSAAIGPHSSSVVSAQIKSSSVPLGGVVQPPPPAGMTHAPVAPSSAQGVCVLRPEQQQSANGPYQLTDNSTLPQR